VDTLGTIIRRERRRLGLTLDELAGRTGISKPYLSLIETGRVPNPPSDEKLTRIEQTLGFKPGELVTQGQLMRTPRDVRALLSRLIDAERSSGSSSDSDASESVSESLQSPISLDSAYLSGALRERVELRAGNVDPVGTHAVPVINRISAGYPRDFTDLSYPKGVADAYLSCPDVADPDAFAARVHGDSMTPKYREGDIVIFSPKAAVRSGDDAFVRFDDGHTTFKRVFFESDDADSSVVRLQPRNERYRPQIVKSQDLTGVYRAVYKYQSVED
jgi:SOS-response transcriptional repressor LexA